MALPSKLDSKYNYSAWKKSGYDAPGKRPRGFSNELPRIDDLLQIKKKNSTELTELKTRLGNAASIAESRRNDLMTPLASMSSATVRKLKTYLTNAEEYYNKLAAQITQEMIEAADEKAKKNNENDSNERNIYTTCMAELEAILNELTAKHKFLKDEKPGLKQAVNKAESYLKKIAPEAKKRKGTLQLAEKEFKEFDEDYMGNIVRNYWDFDGKSYIVSDQYEKRIKETLGPISIIGNKEYKKKISALASNIQSCRRDCISLAKELAALQSQLAGYVTNGPAIYKAYCGQAFIMPGTVRKKA